MYIRAVIYYLCTTNFGIARHVLCPQSLINIFISFTKLQIGHTAAGKHGMLSQYFFLNVDERMANIIKHEKIYTTLNSSFNLRLAIRCCATRVTSEAQDPLYTGDQVCPAPRFFTAAGETAKRTWWMESYTCSVWTRQATDDVCSAEWNYVCNQTWWWWCADAKR